MNRDYSEGLARALFEEAGDALFLFEPQTDRLLDVNPVAERLTGFPRSGAAPAAGDVPVPLRRPGRHEAPAAGLPRDDALPFAGRLLPAHPRGRRLDPVNLTVARLHVEPRTLALITARDVSDRKRVEEALAQRAQPAPRPDGPPARPHLRQGRAKSVSHGQRRHGPDARRPKPGAGPGQDRLRLPAARAGRAVPRRRAGHPPNGQAAAQRRGTADRRGRPEQMAADHQGAAARRDGRRRRAWSA